MASTASISVPVNNPSSPVATSTSSQKDGAGRTVKANQASRMTQKGRKESPSDSNRQSTSGTPKAWSGTNPITQQRASTPLQNQNKPNTTQNKNMPTAKSQSTKDVLSDKHNNDRLRFLLGGSVGLQVVFITKAGDKYEGVFAGFAGSKISLKMTKKVINNPITQPNGISSWEAAFTGSSPDFAMTFDLKDMADLTIPEFSLPETARQTNGATTSFQTDTDISGNANRAERTLQRWVPDASDTADFSLEAGSATGWDQFATHAAMTGGQSSYVEELYTTAIDRNAPDFRRREAQAAKIAREIEAAPSANAHVREERGQALENDPGDEEDKYSGVRRTQQEFQPLATGNSNRYVPPSMRAPSGQPTASGAPFDPAIISSQVARPEASQAAASSNSTKSQSQARAVSSALPQSDQPLPIDRSIDLSKLMANGSVGKASQPKQMVSPPPERQETEPPSQGVERKVLGAYKQFVEVERARIAEKRRIQANQDRTAKINDLIRFSTTFKLKTPVPEDLVGILAKDPKKQEAIIEKAQRDHDDSKTTPPSTASSPSSSQLPSIPKFDKSQIPPPIPERSALVGGKGSGTFPKSSLGRGGRVPGQPLPFGGANVPLAPRAAGSKAAPVPTPIPMPEIKSHQSTAGNSGVSSPRGIDTPTSAVSTKFKFNPAAEFRPTFAPSTASVSAASPSPIKRVAQPARSASPATFFGQRKPLQNSQRLDISDNFNPIKRMHDEVKTKLAEGSEDKRDFTANGGIPNAYHTNPTWLVPADNQEKTHEDFFRTTPAMSPTQSRNGSHQALPFQAQMPHMAGGPQMPQAVTPQHGHHGPHYQQHFDDQRMHMPNGSPSMFASPNMTPRGAYASPMGHPAQPGYGPQSYFGMNGPMAARPYGNNAAMMHGQHGNMTAPMMVQQQSSGPYMGMSNQMGMVFPSPRTAHVYPQQQNGYPSPGPMAPLMMHQGSQQGYGNQSMMYANQGHAGMYGGHPQMGRGYGGSHTPYGSSPHQPHHLGQRAMSSGYGQKVPQLSTGPPSNAPQQPAAFGQAAVREEAK